LVVLDSSDMDSVLSALERRRAEVESWMDGPVKKATLTSIDRMIADLEEESAPNFADRAKSA
jgi:hypothetical protein